jgi:hypothetical protein
MTAKIGIFVGSASLSLGRIVKNFDHTAVREPISSWCRCDLSMIERSMNHYDGSFEQNRILRRTDGPQISRYSHGSHEA